MGLLSKVYALGMTALVGFASGAIAVIVTAPNQKVRRGIVGGCVGLLVALALAFLFSGGKGGNFGKSKMPTRDSVKIVPPIDEARMAPPEAPCLWPEFSSSEPRWSILDAGGRYHAAARTSRLPHLLCKTGSKSNVEAIFCSPYGDGLGKRVMELLINECSPKTIAVNMITEARCPCHRP